MDFAIKAHIRDAAAPVFEFSAAKTMYGGKNIAAGDTAFLFASENEGGSGLVACGIVTRVTPVPRNPELERQTPRVNVKVKRTLIASRPLGRAELKDFKNCKDGGPQSELNFKLYRQATNKIVGISEQTAAFLKSYF